MSDIDMRSSDPDTDEEEELDAAAPLDLSHVPQNFITMLLDSMSLSERFTCALVCKAWAEAATAATRSIILRDSMQDLSCFQHWLQKHGNQMEVLQLHKCDGAVLTALPCPQLQNLLLSGSCSIESSVWSNIAAATKLTSVSLEDVQTASPQAAVVSALTALPDLKQLTWRGVECGRQQRLTNSSLLKKLTKLTALSLFSVKAAKALEHLGVHTGLQHLSIGAAEDWAAAGCPGLQELKALTRLELWAGFDDIPASVSQLTALQELDVARVTLPALSKLSALTGLTQLQMYRLVNEALVVPTVRLPGLQHLKVVDGHHEAMPMSFLANCTQLRVLKLCNMSLSPGSLGASTMLQHVELDGCNVSAANEAADPVSWQQVFPGPGRLAHLTSLRLVTVEPDLQQAGIECVLACCSNLQVLHIDTLPDAFASALACLPGLTSLGLEEASDDQCSSLAQLTGLRELSVINATDVFAAGLQHLAALEQLTSLRLDFFGWSLDEPEEEDMLDGPRDRCLYKCLLINKAPAGQPPDISARLRRACNMPAGLLLLTAETDPVLM